ncbi:MAG: conjugal transfer protein TraH [Mesorhizobium sp.]|uniref:TraH family protein n=1 Tax=Mesorhizobium sp. TaxID=1871066 RepID=UPI000FE7C893|nr:TraH family protein [Mesorhizobium sp.]RWF84097.1 MAG: conjugal transfer protein TraH [Mesorhizobium sp.]
MIDAAVIQQCANPALKPAIVERFIAEVGKPDPLAVTVRSGDRVVLVPKPATPDDAIAIMRQYVGKAVVRVGITQYPAGYGISDLSELKPDLVDACENIRMGTALFGKVYRIVTKWYGNAVDEAFDDAIHAWRTGYFDGKAVFSEPDPGDVKLAAPAAKTPSDAVAHDRSDATADATPVDDRAVDANPNSAGIRIDLSAIGGSRP